MSVARSSYRVHALRYATRESTKSQEFFRYDVYQCPDEFQRMDYFFWLIRNEEFTLLVDCGFDKTRGLNKNRVQETSPITLLERMAVAPSDVDLVIITHMHYNHVGNVELFRNADVIMAKEEYDFWSGPYGNRDVMRSIVLEDEMLAIHNIERQCRLRLVIGSKEVVPGVVVSTLGGHTPGQAIVEIHTGNQAIVLASDAAHFLEEIELDRPFKLFDNIGAMYRALDHLRELVGRPDTTVVAGHDPRVIDMFNEVQPYCFDLTSARPVSS